MTSRSGHPSLWRRLTDLGTDPEVRALALPPGEYRTTTDALAAGISPAVLAERMARLADAAGRPQLTVASRWHDPSDALEALDELEQLWEAGRRGVWCQRNARSVVRLVRGEPPSVSDRRSARRRRPLAITLSPEAMGWLTSEACRQSVPISTLVERLVDRDRADGLARMYGRSTSDA